MDKEKTKMSGVVDLTSSFSNVSSNLCGFMEGMNSHLSSIASALLQQHEQVLLARKIELDGQKKNLFNEVIKIPDLTRIEAMMRQESWLLTQVCLLYTSDAADE